VEESLPSFMNVYATKATGQADMHTSSTLIPGLN